MLATIDNAIEQLCVLIGRCEQDVKNATSKRARRDAMKARRDAINVLQSMLALRDDLIVKTERALATVH